MPMRQRWGTVLLGLMLLTFVPTQPGLTQSSDELKAVRREIEALKEGQTAIQKELQEIKTLLRTRPAAAPTEPQNVVLSVEGAPFKGDKRAKVTLIDFSDYQWPFCARHVRETLPQIESEYIKTGKVKYVALDFPLESIHKNAFKAAEAARCASDQGKFWEMHDRLFANQQALAPNNLPQHAQAVGLDMQKFQQCLDGGKYTAEIRKDLAEGQKAGITGTPAFLLGVTVPNDPMVKVIRVLKGAQPYTAFKAAIDDLLSSQK